LLKIVKCALILIVVFGFYLKVRINAILVNMIAYVKNCTLKEYIKNILKLS